MRDRNLYDVLQMSGIDTWTALASGAYVLAENYLYTEEALRSMFSHLEPGGVLQIIRFSRDMEILRLLSSTHAAFQSLGLEQFENSILVFRTEDRLAAMLVKPGGFLPAEITKAEEFAKNNGIETVYTPSRLYKNITAEFVRSDDKQTLIEDFPRNISPTTDDNPYFFNYTKWHNPFQSVVYMDEPLAVSQGSPIFILAQLLLVSPLSFLVILVPIILFKRRGVKHADTPNLLIYFAGIGLGFIAIEITLMQKLTLLLGHPMYSLTVTLFSLLVFTGIGSLASIRWLPVVTTRVWSVPIVLAALLLILLITSPWIVETFVAWPLVARILVTICVMAPVGIVLGIPFAHGIRVVNRVNPAFVPWAWAVNGCFTVIGSGAIVKSGVQALNQAAT